MTLFICLFFPPTGLVAVYLVGSGTLQAVAAYADREDARGDIALSFLASRRTPEWNAGVISLTRR